MGSTTTSVPLAVPVESSNGSEPRATAEFRTELADFPSLEGRSLSKDELVRRNKLLMASLLDALTSSGRDATTMQDFKAASANFRGQLDAAGYLAAFQRIFGEEATMRFFPELAKLMPNPAKRGELLQVF